MFLNKYLLLIIILGAIQEIKAIVITGKVVTDKIENPLDAASVFLNNTTYGTLTNAKGEFKLDVPSGHYKFIVTYIGYNTYAKDIDINDSIPVYSLIISLSPKTYSISEVTISANTKDWARNYARFKIIFLGTTPNSSDCEILNPRSIRLFRNKATNQLEGYSDTFIIVKNKALGYLLKFKLESFISDRYGSFYFGYPLFEDISVKSRRPKAILKRRVESYEGSIMHFFRSLYLQTTNVEGFICRKIEEVADTKPLLLKLNLPTNSNQNNSVMKNPLLLKSDGDLLIQTEDSIKISEFVRDTLNNIKVLYYGEPFEVAFNKKEERNYYENRSLYTGIKGRNKQQTSILFIRSKIGMFDKNGVLLNAKSLLIAGYMGWKRIADMLPDNYEKPPLSVK